MGRVPVTVRFEVPGTPAPQGSKVRTRYGGMREANPQTMPWRAAVSAEAALAMADRPPIHGPVIVDLILYFPRPKAHYRTGRHAGEIKPGAPRWVQTKPDGDKCARAILDALTGIVYRDDSQAAHIHVAKLYGHPTRAEILVRPLDDEAAA